MANLLDTNFLSELRKPRPEPRVLTYFSNLAIEDQFISDVSLAEIRFGIEMLPDEGRRLDLLQWLNQDIRPLFATRTLPINEAILLRWRLQLEHGRKSGRTFSQPDLFLAATAIEHGLTLVTRNTQDFKEVTGLLLFNPWEATP